MSFRSFELEPKGTQEAQVFMIFQKDCGACREQVKEMLCLKSPVYLLGAFSSEKELRGETRRLGSRYPAYLASGRFLARLGVEAPLTPQVVVMAHGKLFLFQGLTPCESIQKVISNQKIILTQ